MSRRLGCAYLKENFGEIWHTNNVLAVVNLLYFLYNLVNVLDNVKSPEQ